MSSWFEIDSHACFLVDGHGHVRDANGAAADLMRRQVVSLPDGMLNFGMADADEALIRTLGLIANEGVECARLVIWGADQTWRKLEFRRTSGPGLLIFVSVRGEARSGEPAMAPLAKAFDLTPAQARVMGALAGGMTPQQAGGLMDISTHTVRTHLRAIYRKLRVRGLTDALRLTAQLMDSA